MGVDLHHPYRAISTPARCRLTARMVDKAKPLRLTPGDFAVCVRPGRREAARACHGISFRVWWYWQLGDICVTAPNRRPAAITKIVAQIEYAHSGEVKDDSAEESKADYSSRGYQGLPEWSVGWWRKRLHFRLSNVGQVAMPLPGGARCSS